jgi:hypothetical protein
LFDIQTARVKQRRLVAQFPFAFTALLRAWLFGRTTNNKSAAANIEDKLDLGQRSWISVMGSKRLRFLFGFRRLSEKRKRQRAENRRLARSGLPINPK